MIAVPTTWDAFENVWVIDSEFHAPDGERLTPYCVVGRNCRTGAVVRWWYENGQPLPYGIGARDLVVAFFASAELGCHLALHWPMPVWILDLFVEFRQLTNGQPTIGGSSLLAACHAFGVSMMDATEKTSGRGLAIRGAPFTADERVQLLQYCDADVVATSALFERMRPYIDLPRALVRGRYMAAVARMERTGVPIDVPMLSQLRSSWSALKSLLIARVDREYGVFDDETFKLDRFEQYLQRHAIPWDRTETGRLQLDDETFRERSRSFPILNPLRELRVSLAQLRLTDLAVGSDGRNRTLLSPFRASSGRNAPSTSKFIFGPATWLRHLIQPAAGRCVVYLDWSQQEFGIAAALSGDPAMCAAYNSGDPYLTFAQQAGAAPADATKASHGDVREAFKACTLAVQYGMAAEGLARRIGQSPAHAAYLLKLHRQTYPKFWRWSDSAVMVAMLTNRLRTVFGWTVHVGDDRSVRSLRNFPMQANGSEMLRLACCLATEAGIAVCAPVHDALLIETLVDELEPTVERTQACMLKASEIVLSGFRLRSSATVIRHPDRFTDVRGVAMWRTIQAALNDLSLQKTTACVLD